MADLRFAFRILARSPLLTLVVVLSLGLGIGANTAIFSLLYQVVLRSLPVEKPEELVLLQSPQEFKSGRNSSDNSGGGNSIFSYRAFRHLESNPQGVTAVAGFRRFDANLAFGNQTVDGSVMVVSGSYFPVLGVRPRVGRLLTPEDDVHGAGRPVAVLSHGYWQNRLGANSNVLNQPIRVNGQILTVVGITPAGFTGTTFGDQPDVFVPLALKASMTPGWDGRDSWSDYWLYLFARLSPGVTRAQAEAAMNVPYRAILAEQVTTKRDWRRPGDRGRFLQSKLTLHEGRQGQSSARDDTSLPIKLLMLSTALVLLIAIANTANLLLARAAQRRKELSIRIALGAGRSGIARQMLTEAMLLSIAGGAAGLIIGAWTLHLILLTIGDGTPTEQITASMEWPVLLFAAGLSLCSGLLCGLYPAWDASRTTVSGALKDQSSQSSGNLGAARVRRVLVCAQVMISVVLLVPTGLFLKSLVNLTHVDLGVKTENTVTFRISPELNGYKPAQSRALFERVEEKLAALPGSAGVSASMVPLIAGNNYGTSLTVEGYSRDPNADTHSMFNSIGPGFFGRMGAPLIAGREFTDRDTLGNPKVAIINERFAAHFFGSQNPLGRKFTPGLGNVTPDIEIVGVVKDSHYSGVKQTPPRVFYTPWRQSENIGSMSFYLRSALPMEQMIPQLRQAMRSLDPDLPLERLRTFDEQIRSNIGNDRIVLHLSAVFAGLATLLAMLGLYGVMAYSVTRRTREIGIRMALGAPRGRIRTLVLRELLFILAAGVALGVPAALAVGRFAENALFGVKAFDAAVVAGAIAALVTAALLAGYLPARRATKIDPLAALRHE